MPVSDRFKLIKDSFHLKEFKAILDELEQYNQYELFYRRCYELRNDDKALADYVASFNIRELQRQNIIFPQQFKKPRIEKYTENQLFTIFNIPENRNIWIQKHNRFTPTFVHSHEFFEIIFVLSGECVNVIYEKRITLSTGNLCFITPNTKHTLEVFDDSIVLNIIIKKHIFDEILFHVLTVNNIISKFFMDNLFHSDNTEYIIFENGNDIEIIRLFFFMLDEQTHTDEHSDRIMENMIFIYFLLLVRKQQKTILPDAHAVYNNKYWNIITYINEHFRTLTLSKVSEHFGFSICHCSRLIKSMTGTNFTTLVRHLRLSHAKSMLVSSNVRIYDISYSMGYENEETFIRAFKKEYGVSPNKYRQSNTPVWTNK